jgi:hypothetical protein
MTESAWSLWLIRLPSRLGDLSRLCRTFKLTFRVAEWRTVVAIGIPELNLTPIESCDVPGYTRHSRAMSFRSQRDLTDLVRAWSVGIQEAIEHLLPPIYALTPAPSNGKAAALPESHQTSRMSSCDCVFVCSAVGIE